MLLVIITALVAIPIAAAVATSLHDTRAQVYAQESRDRRLVTATVVADADRSIVDAHVTATAPVRWQDGAIDRVDTAQVDPGANIGDSVQIWVSNTGEHVAAPRSHQQAEVDAIIGGSATWAAVAGGAAASWVCLLTVLNRLRRNDWEHELRTLDGRGRTGNQF